MKHSNVAFFIPHIGCPNRCSFCNQNAISGVTDIPRAQDIKNTLSDAIKNMSPETLKQSEIAFFGGSFTAINREYMIELLESAQEFIGENKFSGIRVSTRPDAINHEILSILKKYNVTSIELGAQSMDNEVLKENFRGHTFEDICDASELIKQYGFSLGLQMMTGLYKDTFERSIETANKIIALAPQTVRIYPTVVLKGTYLEKLFLENKYSPLNVDETVKLCAQLLDLFEKNDIKVIRVGLHDQPTLKEDYVAGAYHPALGELIMGERLYNRMFSMIEKQNCQGCKFKVHPKLLSQAIGQNKCNIRKLADLGFDVSITADNSLKYNEIKLI